MATRRRVIDPLDTDLGTVLERKNRRLYRIVECAMRYRRILAPLLTQLRAGADPGPIRVAAASADSVLRELKKLAREV